MISNVSIIVAIEQIGPILRGTTSHEFQNAKAEAKVILYFTQRVVFHLGIGNQQVQFGHRFHGPIELIDLNQPQEVLILPIKFKDELSSDPRIQNYGRDVITCLHFSIGNSQKEFIQEIQDSLLEKTKYLINNFAPDFDYSYVNNESKVQILANLLNKELKKFVDLRQEAANIGRSLYHLGTIRRLEEPRRIISLALLENTKGITYQQLEKKIENKLNHDTIKQILHDLEDMGYVESVSDEENQIIYRIK